MSGVGPIPASKIDAMAHRFGDEVETFKVCMVEMDKAYINATRPLKEGEHRVLKTPLKPGALSAQLGSKG